jgi:hypothetical protein
MYDTDIQDKIKNLEKILQNKAPKTKYRFINATYWDDGDYELSMNSTWGEYKHSAIYRKSYNKYYYHKSKRELPYDKEININSLKSNNTIVKKDAYSVCDGCNKICSDSELSITTEGIRQQLCDKCMKEHNDTIRRLRGY